MVERPEVADGEIGHFVLTPNRSLSWRGNLVFVASITLIAMSIAIGFALLGLWLVLPFAGLEVGLLFIALYITALKGHCREELKIDKDRVVLSRARVSSCSHLEVAAEFQRAWVRVQLKGSGHAWYPSRLLLGSHGKSVELGRFLSDEERVSLAQELANVLGWRR